MQTQRDRTCSLSAAPRKPQRRKSQSIVTRCHIEMRRAAQRRHTPLPGSRRCRRTLADHRHFMLLRGMVARDGVEPPTPAFSDHKQQALPTTYKSRETAEVLANTMRLVHLLTEPAGERGRIPSPKCKTHFARYLDGKPEAILGKPRLQAGKSQTRCRSVLLASCCARAAHHRVGSPRP